MNELTIRDEELEFMRGSFARADGTRITVGILPSEFVRLLDFAGVANKQISTLTRELQEARADNEKLRAELEARRLKWQTGVPSVNGRYWVRFRVSVSPFIELYSGIRNDWWQTVQWAGPISPPDHGPFSPEAPVAEDGVSGKGEK